MPDILYERPLAIKELMGVGFRGEARRLIVSSVVRSTTSVQSLQREIWRGKINPPHGPILLPLSD